MEMNSPCVNCGADVKVCKECSWHNGEWIPKVDYENRLKADMVAMLTEIQLQMEEYEPKWIENDEQAVASCRTWEDLDGIIQQKINSLKAESEPQESEEKE